MTFTGDGRTIRIERLHSITRGELAGFVSGYLYRLFLAQHIAVIITPASAA